MRRLTVQRLGPSVRAVRISGPRRVPVILSSCVTIVRRKKSVVTLYRVFLHDHCH